MPDIAVMDAELFNRQLGMRLRMRRRLLGMTQARLGYKCGVSFQQIQKYESAASGMTAVALWRLAEALDVPMEYFCDGLEPPWTGQVANAT